jgi:hypothetical protein
MPSGQSRITDFTREVREERVEERESGESRQGGEPKVGIAVPSILIEDLARELGIPTTITEDLVNWILDYLSKYWSVGFDRLVFDLAAARDEEVRFSLEVLGIEVRERKITDYGIARLRTIVNTIIKYLEKAGLIEYVRDLSVVNLAKGGGGGDRPG